MAGSPALPPEGRSDLCTVVVDGLVDAVVLGSATGAALATVRSRGALPYGNCDRGLLRGDRGRAEGMVHKRLRSSRLGTMGKYP